jgi:tRNA modification GTPase
MSRGPTHGETHDTIAAIITPPGEGGIAAVRIAGPRTLETLNQHFTPTRDIDAPPPPFLLRLGHFKSTSGEIFDEVMAVFMPAGHSYTGLDQAEIFCHGGQVVVRKILEELLSEHIRAAEPGEFTRLAFESGRIDLAKAEAVADIIAAQTEISFRASREHLIGRYSEHIEMLRNGAIGVLSEVEAGIDFTEDAPEVSADPKKLLQMLDQLISQVSGLIETYRGGRIINEGFTVVIGGRPNAGKSSLFNILLKHERALVTPTAGTTRDYLLERIDLDGYMINLIDTAGLRQGGGKIEREGQRRALEIISRADLLLWLVDLSKRGWQTTIERDIVPFSKVDIILLGNKIDVVKAHGKSALSQSRLIKISCKTGIGNAKLRREIIRRIASTMPDLTSGLVVTSLRHKQKLSESLRCLKAARAKTNGAVSGELVAYDLRQAVSAMSEITGKVYTEQILGRIFSRFCIGK